MRPLAVHCRYRAFWMLKRTHWLTCAAAVLLYASAARAESPATPSRRGDLELIVDVAGTAERWEIDVRYGGKSTADRWDTAFSRCFEFADVDENGRLEAGEVRRLPSAFALRQILWGRFLYRPGHAPALESLDADHSGDVTLAEMNAYYRSSGVGGVWVAYGVAPHCDELTHALVGADADAIDETAWRELLARLSKYDRDGDHLITADELLPDISYPGVTATQHLPPPAGETDAADDVNPPVMVLPLPLDDTHWAERIVRARADDPACGLTKTDAPWLKDFAALDASRNGFVSAAELTAWRTKSPDLGVAVTVNADATSQLQIAPAGSQPRLEKNAAALRRPGLKTDWRIDQGTLSAKWERFQRTLRVQFQQQSGGTDRVPVEKLRVMSKASDLAVLALICDRDGDDVLTAQELQQWIAVTQTLVDAQMLLSILDYEQGLFEYLDVNHSASLSASELRGAWGRFRRDGLAGKDEKRLQLRRIPRQLQFTLSLGLPQAPRARRAAAGPEWFTAMDRNGDGELSRGEFISDDERFGQLDRNGDHVITAAEASASQPK